MRTMSTVKEWSVANKGYVCGRREKKGGPYAALEMT